MDGTSRGGEGDAGEATVTRGKRHEGGDNAKETREDDTNMETRCRKGRGGTKCRRRDEKGDAQKGQSAR